MNYEIINMGDYYIYLSKVINSNVDISFMMPAFTTMSLPNMNSNRCVIVTKKSNLSNINNIVISCIQTLNKRGISNINGTISVIVDNEQELNYVSSLIGGNNIVYKAEKGSSYQEISNNNVNGVEQENLSNEVLSSSQVDANVSDIGVNEIKKESGFTRVKKKQNSNKSSGIVAFSAILFIIAFVLLVISALFLTKTINFTSAMEVNDDSIYEEEIEDEDDEYFEEEEIPEVSYKLGDRVVIASISSVSDNDYSKWIVLDDDMEYVTLMNDFSYSEINTMDILKDSKIEEFKKILVDNEVILGPYGEIRYFSKNDLEYFSCDLNNNVCDNSLNINVGLTSIIDDNNKLIVINDNKITRVNMNYNYNKYDFKFIIRVLKSNIDKIEE